MLCLLQRIKDIDKQIKTNHYFIDDVRDRVKHLASLMDICINIPEEIERQFGKMKKEIVIKNVLGIP